MCTVPVVVGVVRQGGGIEDASSEAVAFWASPFEVFCYQKHVKKRAGCQKECGNHTLNKSEFRATEVWLLIWGHMLVAHTHHHLAACSLLPLTPQAGTTTPVPLLPYAQATRTFVLTSTSRSGVKYYQSSLGVKHYQSSLADSSDTMATKLLHPTMQCMTPLSHSDSAWGACLHGTDNVYAQACTGVPRWDARASTTPAVMDVWMYSTYTMRMRGYFYVTRRTRPPLCQRPHTLVLALGHRLFNMDTDPDDHLWTESATWAASSSAASSEGETPVKEDDEVGYDPLCPALPRATCLRFLKVPVPTLIAVVTPCALCGAAPWRDVYWHPASSLRGTLALPPCFTSPTVPSLLSWQQVRSRDPSGLGTMTVLGSSTTLNTLTDTVDD
ncbi:hypothetical protein GGX14DRAFT_391773 [Mycena pura]|uniref:Uncharacterized protein n=1 Tax=Mycena pura TaxID=153505 RepID=A0AAD6YG34_9AGAR|nr:hypothetical protein GGX14DRAFT_391773 [Mycena pura]